ncbi:MAG: lactate utilization protein [Firmicutes bacterium]|nr:lactate utilization protein [Bacillota bacterium]MBQ4371314.1 lactate utilization protein [Bacillota bacterium]
MDFSKLAQNLKDNGFAVSCFATAAEASDYLNSQIDGETVGIGGSMTVEEMGLYDTLKTHNEVYWHWHPEGRPAEEVRALGSRTDVFLTSVNGIAETGEIINIDGSGNRVAGMLYGHKKVYLIVGENKVAPDYEQALWRARNIAAPLNAKRLNCKTPCAVNGDRCYDCKVPGRICRGVALLWKAPTSMKFEVVLVGEKLGY